ncbi:MAG: hypothetical protein A2359_02730 [Candidatus Moranbacteria bacterium RIFOXYB1_FULL_43_19]|nr:MAG: hypothetical protein A2359_02730 [Candidatus Moranbacteria bacterium RIFOXYB1_FULL_43_19]OGI28848.1 MAG: hypothetical protein A2184_00605 [Candidatus Moranbacteria bacterium RIFOXYA1_FULL_44_7]OGI33950.1 MAG: hypothetical protein A2420_03580 [Candidatus Moranbacteria bacterium RIFOXYC1_FULL_44_13]OGI37297.1 MAG: hypothetical protein A2612_04885 [Candidatus Moranbacteria bacterium RIFOXYD1_FULL_44_12]
MKTKRNKKLFSALTAFFLIVFNVFSFNPKAAQAFSCYLPGICNVDVAEETDNALNQTLTRTDDIFSSVEERYGFSKDIWRVAQRKETAPRVELFFDNTNPKPGEKVTAHAMPEFFKNDPQNLYYTWYLIHTDDGTPQAAKNSIGSGKREAAKIMARGDYDPELDGQNYADSNNDPDQDGWPMIDDSYDEDAVAAPMGGADGVGGLGNGSENTDPGLSEYCGTHPTSANCSLYTTTSSFDLYYRFNGTQSNIYCNSCSSQSLPWGTLSSNNECCYLISNPGDPTLISYDSGINYCPSFYNAAYESCFDYASLQATNEGVINACLDSEYATCEDSYEDIHSGSDNVSQGESTSSFSRCYKHKFGTNAGASGFRGFEGSSNTYGNDDTGLDYDVSCRHKWESAPTTGSNGCTSDDCASGSGRFPNGEEKYWRTDPNDPDTDGDGFNDEADVIGLGQQDFTWTYQAGDRVGVTVEGTSMIPTDEQNAYYKIMWGYLDVCDSTKAKLLNDDLCDGSSDYGFGFLATMSPNEQENEKLKLSLSYSPDNPVADPSGENSENIEDDGSILNADQISVTSSLDNTQYNPNLLYYTWQIQRGDPVTDDWGSALDIGDNFDTTSSSSGLGLTDFSFTPKKEALTTSDNGIIYFKVTATAAQASGVEINRGRSSVVVPVNKNGVRIDLYKVNVSGGEATLGEKICTEGLYAALCPAVKGQMLAAKISGSRYNATNSEFSWQTNGNVLNTPTNVSEYFDGWSSTTVFFPITREQQQLEEVSVTVTPTDKLEPVKAGRLITVVEPVALVRSSDTNTAWPKTQIVQSGSTKNSYQTVNNLNMLETFPGSDVSLYLDFVPDYLLADDENTTVDWQIGGISINDEAFDETYGDLNVLTVEGTDLLFTAPETVGAYYDISVNLKKYWSQEEADIMSSVWGIVPRPLESDRGITITTVEKPAVDATSLNSPTQLLAAVGTHLPHYVMYNLRLALTLLVMVFTSFWFYALIQKFTNYEEK